MKKYDANFKSTAMITHKTSKALCFQNALLVLKLTKTLSCL